MHCKFLFESVSNLHGTSTISKIEANLNTARRYSGKNVVSMKPGTHVVVGMSGGVDSSVSAALLREKGYKVTGLFMKNWEDDDADECGAAEDLADAESVCETLGIPLETVNFSYEYWQRVFLGFLDELKAGRTPNPDIVCNVEIKFREFPQWAERLDADFVATGHYARVAKINGQMSLLKAVDSQKDQTYFLHGLNHEALKHVMFPVGGMTKEQVRATAKKIGLSTHDKRGSTGICFIGRRNFRAFIKSYLGSNKGPIELPDGKQIGEHEGAYLYTIGQRTGLGIGGEGDAWYVVDKDVRRNTVCVAQGNENPLLYSQVARTASINWISGHAEHARATHAKVRYSTEEHSCQITPLNNGKAIVEFSEPQRAVTPGQSVVFYNRDTCLGGAAIESVEPLSG